MTSLRLIRAFLTRPEKSNIELAQLITEQGGVALIKPMIKIVPLKPSNNNLEIIKKINLYNKVIITSQYSAIFGLKLLLSHSLIINSNQDWFALGKKTKQQLKKNNIIATIPQSGFTSEDLLNLNDFKNLNQENILIIKGKYGRQYIDKKLTKMGNKVDYIDVYERKQPHYNQKECIQEWLDYSINVNVVTSSENIKNLLNYFPLSMIKNTYLLVPSLRVYNDAKSLGFRYIINSNGASNQAILMSLHNLQSELIRE